MSNLEEQLLTLLSKRPAGISTRELRLCFREHEPDPILVMAGKGRGSHHLTGPDFPKTAGK
jgi:hypothetical protein